MKDLIGKLRSKIQDSIKWKMVAFVILPIALVVTLMLVLAISLLFSRSQSQVRTSLFQDFEQESQRLELLLGELEQIPQRTAAILSSVEFSREEVIYALVNANVSGNERVFGSAIAFESGSFPGKPSLFAPYAFQTDRGIEAIDIGFFTPESGYDYASGDYEWFEVPATTGESLWTAPYVDSGAGNILMSTFAVPFFREQQFLGVATIDIALETIVDSLSLNPDTDYIVDARGRFVANPDTSQILNGNFTDLGDYYDPEGLAQIISEADQSDSGILNIIGSNGANYWAMYSRIPKNGWNYVRFIPIAQVMADSYLQYTVFAFIAVIAVTIGVGLIWYSTGVITRPISALHEAAESASRGEFSQNIELPGNDEIARLGSMMRDMFLVIARNTEDMEKEVSDRTNELLILQANLTRQKDLLEAALNGIDRGIAMYDKELNLLASNHRLFEFTGVNEEVSQGKKVFEILHKLFERVDKPFDTDRVRDWFLSDENEVMLHEKSDGRLIEIRHRPMRSFNGFISTVEDVTERETRKSQLESRVKELAAARMASLNMMRDAEEARKKIHESQQLLQGFVDNSGAAIFAKDKEGKYLLVNKEWEEIVGFDRETAIGATDLDLLEPDIAKEIIANDSMVKQEEEVRRLEESPDGKRTFLSLIFPLYDIDGKVNGVAGISTDITEQKVIERDLAEAKEAAEAATKAKANFLASMSHEIRTPMNAVIGMVDLLKQSELDQDQMHMLQVISDSGESLLAIINDILDISKIEAGRLELDNANINLCEAIESAVKTVSVNAKEKNLRLISFIDPNLPERALGDEVRIKQIIINLVGNAIKFTEQGVIEIRAEQFSHNQDEMLLRLSVRDEGIGISTSVQKKIFTAFTQAELSTTREYGGTGLGLSICERITSMMGGSIRVESEPGIGSTFTVEIPLTVREKEVKDKSLDLSGVRVALIIDADQERAALTRYLEYWNAEIVQLYLATECIEYCLEASNAGKPIDAVVLSPSLIPETASELKKQAIEVGLHNVNFIALIRGGKHQVELSRDEFVFLGADPISRASFLTAVAVCAGRASPEVRYEEEIEYIKSEQRLLSLDEAEQQGRLILVAEDNPTNRDVIGRQLNLLGYPCEIVEDGRLALQAWRSGRFGLLLADCHMPHMDGFELTGKIREQESLHGVDSHIPIIAFTANALQGEAERCLAAGMDAFLSKPVDLKDLKKTLEQWLPDIEKDDVTRNQTGRIKKESHNKKKEELNLNLNSSQPIVDSDTLVKLLGDDPVMIRDVLKDFLPPSHEIIEEIKAGVTGESAEAIQMAAHKLKSSARSIGANELADICLLLETAGKDADMAAIKREIPRLDSVFARVREYIESL